jgi:hypothetical protein
MKLIFYIIITTTVFLINISYFYHLFYLLLILYPSCIILFTTNRAFKNKTYASVWGDSMQCVLNMRAEFPSKGAWLF